MKGVLFIIFAALVFSPLRAMQNKQPAFVDCAVTFEIQVPTPKQESPEVKVDLKNESAITEYLKNLRSCDEIPISMYDTIIAKTASGCVSDKLSDALLELWGINPSILVSGKNNILKSIGDTLADVKNSVGGKGGL